ncbi:MAG TPA: rRNA methyltransferase [Cyclobacteriaceae bacterium]|nr:rRNA methyltransferase [Cyclobacteriaceae bacterium]
MAVHFPPDFERMMQDRLGAAYADFTAALQAPAPVSIRTNPAKPMAVLGASVHWCSTGKYLDERPVFTLDPALHAGGYYVQEASSMFLEQALKITGTEKPQRVLDLCAAPGGKSTHTISLLHPDSLLVSNEAIRGRTAVLTENIIKWGYPNVVVTHNDPVDFQRLPGFFDVVIADAPCSGEGLFRKDPAAVEEWSVKHTGLCASRQQRIIHDVLPALKSGGYLIYSTCTYNHQENLDNIERMTRELPLECCELSPDPAWKIDMVKRGNTIGYQLFPHRVRGEGFFLCIMQKTTGTGDIHRIRVNLQSPTQSERRELEGWVKSPEHFFLFKHQESIRMIGALHEESLQRLVNNLQIINAGTALAQVTRNKFIPDHALAMSIARSPGSHTIITVDRDEAICFLRKDTLQHPGPAGFALIEYEGLGLGWVNVLPNRLNNLYPSSWRIRMDAAKA